MFAATETAASQYLSAYITGFADGSLVVMSRVSLREAIDESQLRQEIEDAIIQQESTDVIVRQGSTSIMTGILKRTFRRSIVSRDVKFQFNFQS